MYEVSVIYKKMVAVSQCVAPCLNPKLMHQDDKRARLPWSHHE